MSPPSGTFAISEAERLTLYQGMLRARMLEKRAYDLFMEGLVQGTTHLGLGQDRPRVHPLIDEVHRAP